jgi:hypothetical protein
LAISFTISPRVSGILASFTSLSRFSVAYFAATFAFASDCLNSFKSSLSCFTSSEEAQAVFLALPFL